MKTFFLIAAATLYAFSSSAQTNTVIIDNGNWSDDNTWSLGHQPIANEIVVIPTALTLVVDKNITLDPDNITLDIYGTVEFQVGKLDLGPLSVITIFSGGSILSKQGNPSDRILIGNAVRFSGSQGTLAGPISLTAAGGPIVLPVKFSAYDVYVINEGIKITWSTEEELNADKFIIERSKDGRLWQTIASLNAIGRSSVTNYYAYTDKATLSEVHYYRVKQIDKDGHFVYTTNKSIRKGEASNNDIRISSSNNKIVVFFPRHVTGQVVISLIGFSGQVMSQQTYSQPFGSVVLAQNSFKGNYIIAVNNRKDLKMARKVVL